MVDAYLRQGPLDHLQLAARAVASAETPVGMSERPFLAHVNIRGDAGDTAFLEAAKSAIGVDLPVAANTVASKGKLDAIWLGPDEWLIQSTAGEDGLEQEGKLAGKLRKAFEGQFVSVTEAGEGRTCITISGARARDVIAKGCPLDLHPDAFGAGQCAQTHIARALTLLHCRDADTIDIHVLRSFAEYLWVWLEDASREYGVSVLQR